MNINLTEYMTSAIENIIREALNASVKNPRESRFILKYAPTNKKAAKKRSEAEKQGIHIPPFLIASISSQCNLHCKGCYARANHACGDKADRNEMPCAGWRQIFSEAENLGISFILLAGGEPLLRKDVIESAAGFPNIVFPILTNGTMIDGNFIDLFDRKRNLVPVLSIEGSEEQTDERRGEGTYATLTGAMEKMKQHGIFYGVSVTVTSENLKTVTNGEFINMLYQSGCRLVFYVEYVPVAESTEKLAIGEQGREFLAQRQESLKNAYEKILFISFPGDEKHVGGCLAAGRGFFHINAAGGAEPCPFSPYYDMNLKECSLRQAIDSPLFKKLKSGGLLNSEHDGGCVLFAEKDEVAKIIEK